MDAVEWKVDWHLTSNGPFCWIQRDPAHCRGGLYLDVVDVKQEGAHGPEEKLLPGVDVEIEWVFVSWVESRGR
jgi:hypothetical protein